MDAKQYKIPVITLVVGLAVGYFLMPHKTKVETREVVKTEVQEVVKVKNNTVTKTVYVKNTDGSEVTTTEVVDKDETNIDRDTKSESLKEKIVTSKGVGVGLYAISQLSELTKPAYGIIIDVPVASKASIFATGDTDKRIGLGVKVEF
jgi:capsular polysaccharide biosynthesis protein